MVSDADGICRGLRPWTRAALTRVGWLVLTEERRGEIDRGSVRDSTDHASRRAG